MARPREDLIIEFNYNIKFEKYKMAPLPQIWAAPPKDWTIYESHADGPFFAVYRTEIRAADLNDLEREIRADGLRDERGHPIAWWSRWEANRWAWFKAAMYARERVRVC